MNKHDDSKCFECSFCNDKFTRIGHLNLHISSVHEGKKPFKCEVCESKFSRNGGLNKHIALVHENKVLVVPDMKAGTVTFIDI